MSTQPMQSAPEVHHLSRKPVSVEAEIVSENEAIVSQPAQFALQRAPEIVLQEASIAAKALRNVIESKPNKVVIEGKTFLTFEDWQTVARFYGMTVAARATNYVERGRACGYECHAEVILAANGQVIGAAQAECLDDEKKWRDKPMFQLRSMAQTRAQAKALRSVLAWVVVMAGYAATPAEEMDSNAKANTLAPKANYTPMHPDRVRKLCHQLANAANRAELLAYWQTAGNEAKKFNDRAALEAFTQAKDARKRELQ